MTRPPLTDYDLYLLNEGTHYRIFDRLGAHLQKRENGREVGYFSVWAPRARAVSVVGDFNQWNSQAAPLEKLGASGCWGGFVEGVEAGDRYKYSILPAESDERIEKSDPYAFASEVPPANASRVARIDNHVWNDAEWMKGRKGPNALEAPITIYEVHLGSWKRVQPGGRWLTYREIAPRLANYVHEMGYTHVELMPVAEHPFTGSWGYQTTAYYAPTARYGSAQDFMYLVDTLHQRGIGVILDWVPAHFPGDAHGLADFDGQPLYEYEDPRKGYNPEWTTHVFDFSRPQVRNFLISNALYWLEYYHIDGIRVDAVSSMLYLDYSRKPGEWVPNRYGGHENLEAISFLREFNDRVHAQFPDVLTIAEESTAFPKVSRPTEIGGLGFDLKWDLGWVHDCVDHFMMVDPIDRKHNHDKLTFRQMYAFSENYVLAHSHDEVVYGKRSLLGKMPGDRWQQFANLRTLFGYMFTLPGKKLLFMGSEFAQGKEWNHDEALDWDALDDPMHKGIQRWVRDLNTVYRGVPALHELDCHPDGFQWVEVNDKERSVLSYLRRARHAHDEVLVACNFTPVPRHNYRLGVPDAGVWQELLNSDARLYGGSGQGNLGSLRTSPVPSQGFDQSLNLVLPPLSVVALRYRA